MNVGGFIAAQRGWVIRGALNGFGWTARRKYERGRPAGPVLSGISLDELAAKIRAAG